MMLLRYLQVLIEIMLLRRGPQDLPSSWQLLGFMAATYCMLTVAQLLMVSEPPKAIGHALAATLLLALYANSILRLRGTPERLVQTLTALYGVGLMLTVIMMGPTAGLAPYLEAALESESAAGDPPGHVLLAYLVVAAWSVVAFGHVYRHAMDLRLSGGIGLAILFEFILYLAFSLSGTGS